MGSRSIMKSKMCSGICRPLWGRFLCFVGPKGCYGVLEAYCGIRGGSVGSGVMVEFRIAQCGLGRSVGLRVAPRSPGGILGVHWAYRNYRVAWHQRGTLATSLPPAPCDGDPGTHHSPQLIHLILQGLCLLGQAGQCLVPVLQLRNLPLQLSTAQALILSATLQPGGGGGERAHEEAALPLSPGLPGPVPR